MTPTLSAAVVISTRGRPRGCADAVESVVSALGPSDCVIVVDQSNDDATATELAARVEGGRGITYIRTDRLGISAGHNLGAAQATTDLVLFTDDDCTVSPTWIDDWRQVFALNPSVGIGFGTVACEPFDASTGFTPHFMPRHHDNHGVEVFRQPTGTIGMGANTAVLRHAWLLVGGCDERLGVGTRFGGAEELDLAYRILRLGFRLAHADRPTVMHDGFRPQQAASALVQTNGRGTGAMYAKHIRCADLFVLGLFAREVARQLGETGFRLIMNRRPLGLRRLRSIVMGAVLSWRLRLDRGRRLYLAEERTTGAVDPRRSVLAGDGQQRRR